MREKLNKSFISPAGPLRLKISAYLNERDLHFARVYNSNKHIDTYILYGVTNTEFKDTIDTIITNIMGDIAND